MWWRGDAWCNVSKPFLASDCQQCQSADSSLRWGLNFRAFALLAVVCKENRFANQYTTRRVYRLVGLVVRRPPRERKIPGSNPACVGIFSGSSHTCDKHWHSSGYPARRLAL